MNNEMAVNTYLATTECKKQNKETEQKQTHRYREHFHSCQIGRGLGGWVKGLRSTSWLLQNSHGDVKCSRGNSEQYQMSASSIRMIT